MQCNYVLVKVNGYKLGSMSTKWSRNTIYPNRKSVSSGLTICIALTHLAKKRKKESEQRVMVVSCM